jgi:sugar O-acyltransferase (sialic acid O-acetyltransferase NeuD family)
MENPVIIMGAGGLGRLALDIFLSNGIIVYCLLDDDQKLHNTTIGDIQIAGATDDENFLKVIGSKCEAFIAVENTRERKALVKLLNEERKAMPVNAIHQRAFVETSATLGHGNLLAARIQIGSYASVGNHCIVHAGAIIEYQSSIADYVQIGAGSIIGAGCIIEEGAFIGAGANIVAGVKIGKNARVGAGSLVTAHVEAGTTVFGVPAQPVKV